MRIVEVRSERAGFLQTLEAMRVWLDQNGRPLVRFETEADGDTIRSTRTTWPRASGSRSGVLTRGFRCQSA